MATNAPIFFVFSFFRGSVGTCGNCVSCSKIHLFIIYSNLPISLSRHIVLHKNNFFCPVHPAERNTFWVESRPSNLLLQLRGSMRGGITSSHKLVLTITVDLARRCHHMRIPRLPTTTMVNNDNVPKPALASSENNLSIGNCNYRCKRTRCNIQS